MSKPVRFTRVLRDGDRGPDVEGVGRALARGGYMMPLRLFNLLPKSSRQTWGKRKQKAVRKLSHGRTSRYDHRVHRQLYAHFDAKARKLMDSYEPPKPKPPTLIEPKQGFRSLDRRLWKLYTEARWRGLSDLGTYNPASLLPSGVPSDHAVFPARAFDVGFSPATGYSNPEARAFFRSMIGRSEVNYVILGNRIWSRARGLHRYTGGGHDNHVHVSGVR